MEHYLSKAQFTELRAQLEKWHKELSAEADQTVHHLQDDAQNFADLNDRATQEEEFNLELRTRDRERKLLRKIEKALKKIEHRTYGYCEECGEEIGVKRLNARPIAELCVYCKSLQEVEQKNGVSEED